MALTLGSLRFKRGLRCYLISGIVFCIFFIIYLNDDGRISAFLNKKVPVHRQVVRWEDQKHLFDSSRSKIMISYKGRMGNHMFEYATLIGMAKRYNMTPIILSDLDILDVFQIPTPQGSEDLLQNPVTYPEEKAAKYAPIVEKINPHRDAYLLGYYQSWKYYENVRDELRTKHFVLHKSIQTAAKDYIYNVLEERQMHGAVLVGIHVRRGDFVRQRVKGFTAAPIPYYYRAMNYFRKKYKKVMFIICTNDLVWAETNLDQGRDVHYSHETDGALDFGIMTNCDHMIITSGSYSWWAGYLVRGEVIYYAGYPMPNTIIGNLTVKEDYYPPYWQGRW